MSILEQAKTCISQVPRGDEEPQFSGSGLRASSVLVWASLVAQLVKNPPAVLETWVQSLGPEGPLEMGKATHSSVLAWRIPWALQSMRSQTDMTLRVSLSR